MTISEPAVILGAGTAVLAILFGARLVMRAGGGAGVPPTGDEASTSGPPDVAGVIALPPLIFLAFLAAATVFEAVVPLPLLGGHALARYLAGAALAVCGLLLIAMGTSRFVAAGTNIPPNLPTTALVVDGIYGRTRNPLYLRTTSSTWA
jgi:protein-S-isoprenylcysteine O-methyltransferase Ste14